MNTNESQRVLNVGGMWCASCAQAVERALLRHPAVKSAAVSYAASTALVVWDESIATLPEVIKRIEKAGYRAAVNVGDLNASGQAAQDLQDQLWMERWLGLGVRGRMVFALLMLPLSLLPMLGAVAGWPGAHDLMGLAAAATVATLLLSGWPIFKAAWLNLKTGMLVMDSVVALGCISAVLLSLLPAQGHGYWDTAQMLVSLLLLSRYIEERTRSQARDAVASLHHDDAAKVAVWSATGWQDKALQAVESDEVIRIAPGQMVPLDVEVTLGESLVSTATFTGEAMPERVSVGSAINGGSRNLNGELHAKVVHAFGQRERDRIALDLHQAITQSTSSAPIANLLARWLIPGVLGLAALQFAYLLWSQGDWAPAAIRALTVLVLACPCALALSEPLVVLRVAQRLALLGARLQNPRLLFQLNNVSTQVVFDKTGTLTHGELSIKQAIPAAGVELQELQQIAAQLASGASHPVALALSKAWGQGADTQKLAPLQQQPGAGIGRILNGQMAWLGSRDWLSQQGVALPANWVDTTSVSVAWGSRYLGQVVLQDSTREFAKDMIGQLRAAGHSVALLSGDQPKVVAQLALELGIDQALAAQKPQDKAAYLAQCKEHGQVMFVGDGLNDALAMAYADVSVALAHAADTTRYAAHVVMPAQSLQQLPQMLSLLLQAKSRIRQNVVLAIGLVLPAVLLASLGWLSPNLSAVLMALGPLCIVLNTWR